MNTCMHQCRYNDYVLSVQLLNHNLRTIIIIMYTCNASTHSENNCPTFLLKAIHFDFPWLGSFPIQITVGSIRDFLHNWQKYIQNTLSHYVQGHTVYVYIYRVCSQYKQLCVNIHWPGISMFGNWRRPSWSRRLCLQIALHEDPRGQDVYSLHCSTIALSCYAHVTLKIWLII